MKRSLCVVLIITFILPALLSLDIFATETSMEIGCLMFSDCGSYCELVFCDTSAAGDIVIPETVDFGGGPLPMTVIQEYAFEDCHDITGITIPESVVEISDCAFSCCEKLESITIPKSVKTIGRDVFNDCLSLSEINVEKGSTEFTSDDGILFSRNKKTLITYPAGREDTHYSIPYGVETIGGQAFAWNDYLTGVTIPDSVKTICKDAFCICLNLSGTVTIPKSVTNIEYGAFYRCDALDNIKVDKDNPSYTTYEGVLFNKDMTEMVLYAPAKSNDYTVPEGVLKIADHAFSGCNKLQKVKLPDSLTEIGIFTFYACFDLKDVILPKNLKILSDDAFCYCEGLTSIAVPKSLTNVGCYAFEYCNSLSTVCYEGSSEDWDAIIIEHGNENLTDAERIYNYTIPDELIGDCNGDGAVDNKDVVVLFRYVSAKKVEYIRVYDYNGDGAVDNKDVPVLFRFVSKKKST